MPNEFVLPPTLDYFATFLWALSGALIGARRGYDFVGVFVVALVSAVGGGLLRDGLFLQAGPPVLVRNADYIALVIAATVCIMVLGRHVQHMRLFYQIIALIDAVGLGAYAVVGMQKSILAGLSLPGVILVGIVNAVGGGLLRDVLMRQEPEILKPSSYYATAVLVGCLVYVSLTQWRVREDLAGWVTIALIFTLRALSVRYRWVTRSVVTVEG